MTVRRPLRVFIQVIRRRRWVKAYDSDYQRRVLTFRNKDRHGRITNVNCSRTVRTRFITRRVDRSMFIRDDQRGLFLCNDYQIRMFRMFERKSIADRSKERADVRRDTMRFARDDVPFFDKV